MKAQVIDTPTHVRRPDGRLLRWSDLPEPGTLRWTARRKRLVVEALVYGLADAPTLQLRYNISAEELREWFADTRRLSEAGRDRRRRR